LSDLLARYTAEQVDAAIDALAEPARLSHAQEVVTHAAPALQRMLATALHEGGWFGSAHDAEVSRVAGETDPLERVRAVDTLIAEQTRLGMFVGVAVGFELARELQRVHGGDVGADGEADVDSEAGVESSASGDGGASAGSDLETSTEEH
jgi:hypothetical protein